MFTISSFSGTESNPDVYGAKDCINKFCESLRGDTIKIINLIKWQQESNQNAKICHICKEKFESKYLKDKKYRKIRDNFCYTGEYRGT